ncbi:HTH-type transcriptional activator CmpR [Peptococcaceae bacterium CEB3]|nr:HTH-type transcriptional activator CmpR [Peptococcaceae bacterium CEB3]
MDNFQLKIFCAVTRLRSFSKAAKMLHMSQPAVSTHIKNLEEYYRGQLFERTPHGVCLTKAGETFYTYAQRMMDLQDEMEAELEKVLLRENNQLVVGASTSIGNVSLPCSIYFFKERYPELTVRLDIANSVEIIRKLYADEVDIGVLEGDVVIPELAAVPVTSDELVLILPAAHPCPDESLSLEDFLQLPLILREEGSGSRRILANVLELQGHSLSELNVVTEMGSIDAIKNAVAAGLGSAVVPRLSVRKESETNTLRVLTVSGLPMSLTYYVVYPVHKSLSTAAKRFLSFITDADENFLC